MLRVNVRENAVIVSKKEKKIDEQPLKKKM